jgi:hypothetical protein
MLDQEIRRFHKSFGYVQMSPTDFLKVDGRRILDVRRVQSDVPHQSLFQSSCDLKTNLFFFVSYVPVLALGPTVAILSSMETAGIKGQTNSSAAAPGNKPPGPVREVSWERMIRAVEKVRERLRRAAAALEKANIRYAVAGGNAVAAWVSRVDEAAVRNTQDVAILLRRSDLPAAKTALAKAGFIYRHAKGLDMFLDGPTAKARDSVHVIFAAEKVRPDSVAASPDVTESEATETFRLVTLDALVHMKLTAFRDKDRTHLRDLIEVGLVDATWVSRLPSELAMRLQKLLDTPEG